MPDSTTDASREQANADRQAEFFADAVNNIANRLIDLSNEVKREGTLRRRPDRPQADDAFARLAENVQHAITWGVANLHTDRLTTKAFAADDAARRAREASAEFTPDDDKAEDR